MIKLIDGKWFQLFVRLFSNGRAFKTFFKKSKNRDEFELRASHLVRYLQSIK
jgi:hypothetical protein